MKIRSLWVPFFLFTLLILSACSRSAFPVGTWRCEKNEFLSTTTLIVRLDSNHTGTIGVQKENLLGSNQTGRRIRWNFEKKILTMIAQESNGQQASAFMLELVGTDGNSVTWRSVGLNRQTETWTRVPNNQ